MQKKRKRIILGIIGLAIAIALCFGGKYLYDVAQYQKEVAQMEIKTPDISLIADGTYHGFYDVDLISAEVSVVVKDHRIADITIIEHKTGRGRPAEVIIDAVVAQQSLQVDTISGATNSSKVILKAIELALS
ncbi:MAG: FMN-binding protein [Coriobacteriia bacterium]|nr:FMN-binding protein [Coriobacteriia bacterium]